MKKNLANFKANSAWKNGIKESAEHLLEELDEVKPETDIKDILHTIQGCDTWTDYCHGGCFCIMDYEVAGMCLTESEKKQRHYDAKKQYVDERKDGKDWQDISALLLYQAENVLLGHFVYKNLPNRATSNYATRK